jgi:hypothetical protein
VFTARYGLGYKDLSCVPLCYVTKWVCVITIMDTVLARDVSTDAGLVHDELTHRKVVETTLMICHLLFSTQESY